MEESSAFRHGPTEKPLHCLPEDEIGTPGKEASQKGKRPTFLQTQEKVMCSS